MSVVINTNYAATVASDNLAMSSSSLQKSLNRLSSGSKIVNPSDDAGGLAVAMKLSAAARRSGATSANIGNGWSVARLNGTVQVGAVNVTTAQVYVPTKWALDQAKCTVAATDGAWITYVTGLTGNAGGNATFSIPAQPCYATSSTSVVTAVSVAEGTKAVSALTAKLATGVAYEIQKIKSASGALQLSYKATDAVTAGFAIKNPAITSTCTYTPAGTVTPPSLANTGGDLEIPNIQQESGKTTFLTQAIVQQALFLDSRWITLR